MTTRFYNTQQAWGDVATSEPRRRSGLVAVVSFLHPLGFCLFPFGLSHLGRLWLIGSLLVACVARGGQFPREVRGPLAACAGGFFVVALALFTHAGQPGFWTDLIRIASACVYLLLCLLAFRGEANLVALGRGLACSAGVFVLASVPAMLTAFRDRASSGTLTLYEQKDTLSAAPGFHINPNMPLLLCALCFGLGYFRPARVWILGAAAASVAVAWIFGVRATFFGAALALGMLVAIQLVPATRRGWSLVVLLVLLLPCGVAILSTGSRVNDVLFFEADATLSGRLTLWAAAWKSFTHHVVWGAGPESWQSQLAIHLPSAHEWREQAALELDAGGFHNGLLHLLAERGVLVGLVYLGTMIAVTACAAKILAKWRTEPAVATDAVPFAFLSLVFIFRSLFEISGFFGYYKGPVDYLCTLLFAVTIMKGLQLWRAGT